MISNRRLDFGGDPDRKSDSRILDGICHEADTRTQKEARDITVPTNS